MKKFLGILLFLLAAPSYAQFVPGQLLTAAELNAQFALDAKLAGATFTGPISATSITNTPISGSSGSFTTLAASGALSGAGFTSLVAPYAPLAGATFTGATGLSYVSPVFAINDSTGTNASYLNFNKSANSQEWSVHANSAGGLFVDRYVSGTFTDTPFSISTTNGTVQMSDGIVSSPISGSTGSFTTLNSSNATTVSYPTAIFAINDSTGAGSANVQLKNTNVVEWNLYNSSTSSNQFALGRYVAGSFVDNPIAVANVTGVVTMGDGIAGTPVAATTLSASGNFTPAQTNGIVGTTTNNNANAGSVGEFVTATGTAVSLTTATTANCTSISLTAGDWDVVGSIIFNGALTTTTSVYMTGINTTSITLPAAPFLGEFYVGTSGTNTSVSVPVPPQRELLSAPTTVYLAAQATFATSTETVTCNLQARRRR